MSLPYKSPNLPKMDGQRNPSTMEFLSQAITRCQGYCELRMYEKAWEELEALPDELRTSAEVYEWRMRVLMGMGENDKASYIGLGLVDQFPGRQDFRLLTVECLLRINQSKEALDLLTAGPGHLWDEYLAWFYLARIQMKLGDLDTARNAITRCSERAPEKRLEILNNPEFAGLW